jgi:hypothetical protein
MTNLKERKMTDADDVANNNGRRRLWMMFSGIGIIMTSGAISGYLSQRNAEGDGALNMLDVSILGLFAAVILLLAFAIWRLFQQTKQSGERVPRRERLNNRIIWGCGIFGGIIGLTLALTGNMEAANEPSPFASGPMSPMLAVILAVAIGVVLPAITFYWHKHVVDEQEDAAYRAGALIAIYAFWFVAPIWWFLWRGGILPAPDGVALYFMTAFIALIVWFWKKYR